MLHFLAPFSLCLGHSFFLQIQVITHFTFIITDRRIVGPLSPSNRKEKEKRNCKFARGSSQCLANGVQVFVIWYHLTSNLCLRCSSFCTITMRQGRFTMRSGFLLLDMFGWQGLETLAIITRLEIIVSQGNTPPPPPLSSFFPQIILDGLFTFSMSVCLDRI